MIFKSSKSLKPKSFDVGLFTFLLQVFTDLFTHALPAVYSAGTVHTTIAECLFYRVFKILFGSTLPP